MLTSRLDANATHMSKGQDAQTSRATEPKTENSMLWSPLATRRLLYTEVMAGYRVANCRSMASGDVQLSCDLTAAEDEHQCGVHLQLRLEHR